jgi:hypothetical protein
MAVFELWDDCSEEPGSLGEAGTRARAQVIGWIRARMPADSAAAYSAAELDELNARRRSRERFAPY